MEALRGDSRATASSINSVPTVKTEKQRFLTVLPLELLKPFVEDIINIITPTNGPAHNSLSKVEHCARVPTAALTMRRLVSPN